MEFSFNEYNGRYALIGTNSKNFAFKYVFQIEIFTNILQTTY